MPNLRTLPNMFQFPITITNDQSRVASVWAGDGANHMQRMRFFGSVGEWNKDNELLWLGTLHLHWGIDCSTQHILFKPQASRTKKAHLFWRPIVLTLCLMLDPQFGGRVGANYLPSN